MALTPQEQEIAEVKLAYDGPLMAPVEAGTEGGQGALHRRWHHGGRRAGGHRGRRWRQTHPCGRARSIVCLHHDLRQLTCPASSSPSKAARAPASRRRSSGWPSALQPRAATCWSPANPAARRRRKPCARLLVSGDVGALDGEVRSAAELCRARAASGAGDPPGAAAGKIVLCDRFMDSTRAYQGYAGGCDLAFIDALEQRHRGRRPGPTLTLIFDLDPAQGLARARARGDAVAEDRYERKGSPSTASCASGFLDILRRDPKRCRLVDAAQDVDDGAERRLVHRQRACSDGGGVQGPARGRRGTRAAPSSSSATRRPRRGCCRPTSRASCIMPG